MGGMFRPDERLYVNGRDRSRSLTGYSGRSMSYERRWARCMSMFRFAVFSVSSAVMGPDHATEAVEGGHRSLADGASRLRVGGG